MLNLTHFERFFLPFACLDLSYFVRGMNFVIERQSALEDAMPLAALVTS